MNHSEAKHGTTARAVALAALLCAGCGDDAAPEAPAAEAAELSAHERMLALLRDVAERTPDEHYYQGDLRARELRAELERLGDAAPWRAYLDAGVAVYQIGREAEGIDLLQAAYDRLEAGTLEGGAAALTEVAFHLGVAHLGIAENENCCAVPTPDSCIVPIRGGGLHQNREGSTNAVHYFTEVLRNTSTGAYWHLAARWLLNLAYMTLGEYPDGVPAPYRLPTSAFESEIDFPRFPNVAADVGLDTSSLSGGVIVDDFDGDDDYELLVSTWDTRGQIRYWDHDGDGTFTDRTEQAGLIGLFGGLNINQADYDNDGDLDFLVLRGAWLFEKGRHPNSLVRNDGDGTFTDVTFDAGLADVHYPTQAAGWADYDNDGDLDLYIGNESSKSGRYPGQLFRNDGDGTFTDVAALAGVQNYRYAKSVAWGDYDGDRLPDLYVSNNGQPNRLYHNRGDGTFVDVAPRLGVAMPETGFPSWFWDYDNDGALDIYAAAYSTGIGHITAYHLRLPMGYETARLYRGDGRGGFEDVSAGAGLDYPALPMGANFGDLDNDGYLDFYLGTGNVFYHSIMPNVMYLNDRGRRFVDVTMAGGFGHVQKGHGIVFADLDGDGDVDVFEQMGGAFVGDGFRDALYENPGFGNHWLVIHAVGRASNRSAFGARIRVDIVEDGEPRSIHRQVNSGGSFGGNPLRQHIGVGKATAIEAVEVFWPTTGEIQRIEKIGVDRAIRVIEGEPGFTEITRQRVTLGGR